MGEDGGRSRTACRLLCFAVRTSRFIVGLAGSVAVATFALGGALVSAQTVSDGRAVLVGSPGCPGRHRRDPPGGDPVPDRLATSRSGSDDLLGRSRLHDYRDRRHRRRPPPRRCTTRAQRGLLASPPWVNLQAPMQQLTAAAGHLQLGRLRAVDPDDHHVDDDDHRPTTTTTTTTAPTTTTTARRPRRPTRVRRPRPPGRRRRRPARRPRRRGATTTTSGATTTTAAGVTTTTIAGPTTTAARATSTLPHTGGGPNTNVIGAAVLILLAGALATMVARRQAS